MLAYFRYFLNRSRFHSTRDRETEIAGCDFATYFTWRISASDIFV